MADGNAKQELTPNDNLEDDSSSSDEELSTDADFRSILPGDKNV